MATVTIYTRQFCGFCDAAKRLLDQKGIDYDEIDATYDPIRKREMIERSNGGRTFPQIFVGSVHVGGCDELHALERDGKLDPLVAEARQ
ncbi:glutaredoxin 3 [Amorphus sp. 3PC139-8]|uniref:glutaredoxin 3 n=1 Tax=Amorphus sp. 3PC139-8 TaxID=2735676 RepID=UPI00345D526B